MEKKTFEVPEIKVVELTIQDVITDSGWGGGRA